MEDMGVVDTKPIESVRASLCLFEEKGDQKKNRPTAMDESEIERELEEVLKDLANSKVQIEAKDAAYMQALLNLENYKKTACEHSAMLKNTEIERDRYKNECGEAAIRIDELKSKMKEMKDQLLESVKIGEQLEHVMNELKASKEELLRSEMELAALKDSESKALKQLDLIEMDAKMDKQKVEELLKHVSELNDAILILEVAATEAEKEKFAMISEKDAQIQVAKMDIVQAQDQLKDMRKEVEMMEELENQFNAKCQYIEVLKSELKQEEEIRKSFEKDASDAINKSKLLKDEIDFKERKILSQEALIDAFKMELNQQKSELKNTNDLASKLSSEVEKLNNDIVKAKAEINEISERETEAQVEIAMLKSEIHKGRSKIAAAEAAEARAESVKSGLYLAVQKLAVEAGSAKKENERLKQEADKADEETDSSNIVSPHLENPTEELDASQINDTDSHVTISMKEYESLIKKAEKEDSNWLLASQEKDEELEILKKELEAANARIAEFRNRAVQAVSRAETAEKAKAQIEDQLRKWREHKQKRKAALAALRDVSVPKEDESIPTYSSLPRTHPQLGKVLNMKF